MSQLWPLFFENLQDNIPSVRQGAAVAIGNVCRAYGKFLNSGHLRIRVKFSQWRFLSVHCVFAGLLIWADFSETSIHLLQFDQ